MCENLTQDCLNEYRGYYNCLRLDLLDRYNYDLNIGACCTNRIMLKIKVVSALLDSLCSVNIDDIDNGVNTCLTRDDVCNILNTLDLILT